MILGGGKVSRISFCILLDCFTRHGLAYYTFHQPKLGCTHFVGVFDCDRTGNGSVKN